jgi:hypothetical protein
VRGATLPANIPAKVDGHPTLPNGLNPEKSG